MSPSGFSGKPGKGVSRMRYLFAALVLAAAVFGTAAQAEKRTFIIANNSDGYGVDRCLATGATCGAAVATAYCKARDYAEAASFRGVEREELARAVPTTTGPSPGTNLSPSSVCAEPALHPRRAPPINTRPQHPGPAEQTLRRDLRLRSVARPSIFGQCSPRRSRLEPTARPPGRG